MELKNYNAKEERDIIIEIENNKSEENIDNIALEILYNSCIEVFPFETMNIE